jgi:hypothetical protein
MRTATLLTATLLLTLPTAKAQTPRLLGMGILITSANSRAGSPFSATVNQTFDQKLADGNAIRIEVHYQIARDASGKTMTESPTACYTGEDGISHQVFHVTVNDRATNTMENWTLSEYSPKIATIDHTHAPVKQSEAEIAALQVNRRPRPAQPSQRQTEGLGSRNFQGVTAIGTRSTQTIPAGQQGNALPLVVVNESWIATKLDLIMMAIRDDPRTGRLTAEIEEFHPGDPDPSLFSPPEGYIIKEQTPPLATVTDPR